MGRHVISLDEHERRSRETADKTFAPAIAAARAAGVELDSDFIQSNRPYEAIAEAAERKGCDAIFNELARPQGTRAAVARQRNRGRAHAHPHPDAGLPLMSAQRVRMLPVASACSGCSSAGLVADHVARSLDNSGLVEMGSIAGIGAAEPQQLTKAKSRFPVIAIDGCAIAAQLG